MALTYNGAVSLQLDLTNVLDNMPALNTVLDMLETTDTLNSQLNQPVPLSRSIRLSE